MSALLDFYRESGTDGAGRRLPDVWAFSDRQLEWHHDFIQWLFPLTTRSQHNPDAPVLARDDIAAFRADPELRARLRTSFLRFLRFLGLELDGESVRLADEGAEVPDVFRHPNHNWLRITRVLTSLRLLGLEAEADAFFAALEELYDRGVGITADTFEYWSDAMSG